METQKTDLSILHQRFVDGLAYTQTVTAKAKATNAALVKSTKSSRQLVPTRRATAKQLLRIRRIMAYMLRTTPGPAARA